MTISRIRGNAAQIGQQIARSVGKEQARAYLTPNKGKFDLLVCFSNALLTLAVLGVIFGVGLVVYSTVNPIQCTTDTDCMEKYGLLWPNDDIEDIDAINADIEEGRQK